MLRDVRTDNVGKTDPTILQNLDLPKRLREGRSRSFLAGRGCRRRLTLITGTKALILA